MRSLTALILTTLVLGQLPPRVGRSAQVATKEAAAQEEPDKAAKEADARNDAAVKVETGARVPVAKDRKTVAEKAKAEREAARKAALAERDQQLEAQAQQYVEALRPSMWRELELVRQTCDLAAEQRPKIKAAAEKGLKAAAKAFVMPQGGRRTQIAATKIIRKEIAQALEETHTADQLVNYRAELDKRSEAIKKSAIASLVARLDSALFLSAHQRDRISKSLEADWKDDWESWLMMWQYGERYFPQVPDAHISNQLTAEQKKVWNGFQKVSIDFWGGHWERLAADDEWWDGPAAVRKEESQSAGDAKEQP